MPPSTAPSRELALLSFEAFGHYYARGKGASDDISMHQWAEGISPDELYRRGEVALEKRQNEKAVKVFEGALRVNKYTFSPTEHALFLLGGARSWLRVENWTLALMEAEKAFDIAIVKISSQSKKWETKLQTAVKKTIEDFERALPQLKDDELSRDENVNRIIPDLRILLQKLERDVYACQPPVSQAGRSSVILSPTSKVELVPPTSSASTLADKLKSISTAHHALAILWQARKAVLVGAVATIDSPEEMYKLAKEAVDGVVDEETQKKLFPELNSIALGNDANLLDFISTRGSRTPADMAFFLDSHEASVYQTFSDRFLHPPPPSLVVPSPLPSRYMLLIDDGPKTRYGSLVKLDASSSRSNALARQRFSTGQACTIELGEALIERQRVLYNVALRAARLLFARNGAKGVVIPKALALYERKVKEREWAGREPFSPEAVSDIAINLKRAVHSHVRAVQTDPTYVMETLVNRLSLQPGSFGLLEKMKDELGEVFINAYARQTLWRDAAQLVQNSELDFELRSIGVVPTVELDTRYERRISLLANLVDAYVKHAHADFKAMIEPNMSWNAVGETGYAQYLAQNPTIIDTPPKLFFSRVAALDPLDPSLSSVELLNMLTRLKRGIDWNESVEIPFVLLKSFELLAQACELRELLNESHRPPFDRQRADPATVLSELEPLLDRMRGCWARQVPLWLVSNFMRDQSESALDDLWDAFEDGVEHELKDSPDRLLANLLSYPDAYIDTDRQNRPYDPNDDEEESPFLHKPFRSLTSRPGRTRQTATAGSAGFDDSDNDSDLNEIDVEEESTLTTASPARPAPSPQASNSTSHSLPPPSTDRPPRRERIPASIPEPLPGPSTGKNPIALAREAATADFSTSAPALPASEAAVGPSKREKRKRRLESLEQADAAGDDAEEERRERRRGKWSPSSPSAPTAPKRVNVPQQTLRPDLPSDFRLKVSRKSFETFLDLFEKKQVWWDDFEQAMVEIGFSLEVTRTNGTKHTPSGSLAEYQPIPINFHPPHGGTYFWPTESRETVKTLRKHFDLRKEHFALAE